MKHLRFLAVLLTPALTALCLVPALATEKRTVVFPATSVGKILILKPNCHLDQTHVNGRILCEARGPVEIPAGSHLMFAGNDTLSEEIGVFAKLPPDLFECMSLTRIELDNSKLKPLAHLTGLKHLELDGTDISDEGVERLNTLTNLQFLSVSRTRCTGKFLHALKPCKQIVNLNLSHNDLSLLALLNLKDFPQLQWLNAGKCRLSNDSLLPIGKLSNLETLLIPDNPAVTDAGIKHLTGLRKLFRLDLRSTPITPKAVLTLKGNPIKVLKMGTRDVTPQQMKELKTAFPGCDVVFDERSERVSPEVFAPLH